MQSDSFLYKFYYQWWKNIDKPIFFLITFLFIIGLFFSLVSTSLIASDKLDTNSYFFFFKHLIYICIGIFIIFIFSSINTGQLFKYSIILFVISLISLFLVPIIGIEVKGSKRWIDLFFKIFKNFFRCNPKIKALRFLHFIFGSLNLSPFLGIPPIIQ